MAIVFYYNSFVLFINSIYSFKFRFFNSETVFYRRIESFDYSKAFPLYLFFLSNVALYFKVPIVGAAQTWSVSVEEQFYLIWPIIFRFFKSYLILFVLLGILLKSILWETYYLKIPFEYMGFGAIMSYLAYYQPKYACTFFKNKIGFYLIVSITIITLFIDASHFEGFIFALLIGFIYFNQDLVNDRTVFNYLGEISYGIYMYHPIIMYFVFELINHFIGVENTFLYAILVYVLAVPLVILVSKLSYIYIEKPMLKIKSKYN